MVEISHPSLLNLSPPFSKEKSDLTPFSFPKVKTKDLTPQVSILSRVN